MIRSRRRTLLVMGACGLALGAAGGIVASASQDSPDQVGPTSTARLGSTFEILSRTDSLPEVPNTAGSAIAANPRAGMPDADAGPARQLATYKGAGLIMMPGTGEASRVCFMTTGLRFTVGCSDKAQLGNGRMVLSVPLARETADTITTTPRVDFLIVPDEVTGVSTSDGPAAIEANVAIAERPNGGPMGAVEYELRDGRRVVVEFATADP